MNDIFSNPVLAKALPEAIVETLQMVGISAFFTVLVGPARSASSCTSRPRAGSVPCP